MEIYINNTNTDDYTLFNKTTKEKKNRKMNKGFIA